MSNDVEPATFVPSGALATNLRRLRQSLTLRELSERLNATASPLAELALGRVENCKRRVDVDELIALAVALGVSPLDLILPPEGTDLFVVPGQESPRTADELWAWAKKIADLDQDLSESETLRENISRLKARRHRLRTEIQKQQNRLDRAQAELKQSTNSLLRASVSYYDLPRPARDIEHDIDSIDDRLASAQVSLQDLEGELQEREAELSRFTAFTR